MKKMIFIVAIILFSYSQGTNFLKAQESTNTNWFKDPNASRLFSTETGRSLESGKGYLINYYGPLIGFNYGVTDFLSIGAGSFIVPPPYVKYFLFYQAKLTLYQDDSLSASFCTQLLQIPQFEYTNTHFGATYGVISYEAKNNMSFTTGIGIVYGDKEFNKTPGLVLGFKKRFHKNISFISENWLIMALDYPVLINGLRFMGQKHTLDLSVISFVGANSLFPFIPFISYAWHF